MRASNENNEIEESTLLTNELTVREVDLVAGKTIDQPFWLSKQTYANLFDTDMNSDYFLPVGSQQQLYGVVRLKIAGSRDRAKDPSHVQMGGSG